GVDAAAESGKVAAVGLQLGRAVVLDDVMRDGDVGKLEIIGDDINAMKTAGQGEAVDDNRLGRQIVQKNDGLAGVGRGNVCDVKGGVVREEITGLASRIFCRRAAHEAAPEGHAHVGNDDILRVSSHGHVDGGVGAGR